MPSDSLHLELLKDSIHQQSGCVNWAKSIAKQCHSLRFSSGIGSIHGQELRVALVAEGMGEWA